MRQAIVTKYLGPTNYRGSRVKATASAGSVTLSWDCALDSEENHQLAANALADKFNWRNPGNGIRYEYVGGGLPDGCGNAYVQIETRKARKVGT
jgi:hypothetical protein